MNTIFARRVVTLALASLVVACGSTIPQSAPVLQGEDRFLIDPRVGAPATSPAADRAFDEGWLAFESGDDAAARTRFDQIRSRNAGYAPADLGLAAIAIREQRLDEAQGIVRHLLDRLPNYLAARIYDAEIAVRQQDLRRASESYAALVREGAPLPPVFLDRSHELRQRLLDQVLASAANATTPNEATPLLREALTIDPTARVPRMTLVNNLLAEKDWAGARAALDPLLASDADRTDVQQALAEIDAGNGQYEQAIARYERLSHRDNDPHLRQRLNELKEEWNAANMPTQYEKALESDAITRADFAVLLYWKATSVRFAQNLATPLIAVDVGEVPGREELIRAIAIGMLQVDPVTRRVNPAAAMTPQQMTRFAAKVLVNRGAACARKSPGDPSHLLAACGVTDLSLSMPPDAPISGRTASDIVAQIDRAIDTP